jgi:hypothetical protein
LVSSVCFVSVFDFLSNKKGIACQALKQQKAAMSSRSLFFGFIPVLLCQAAAMDIFAPPWKGCCICFTGLIFCFYI